MLLYLDFKIYYIHTLFLLQRHVRQIMGVVVSLHCGGVLTPSYGTLDDMIRKIGRNLRSLPDHDYCTHPANE